MIYLARQLGGKTMSALKPLRMRTFTNTITAMDTGRVKFFDSKKGFGFIIPDDGQPDVFVHQTAIHAKGFRSLAEGEEVEFEIGEDHRTGKVVAQNVTGPNGDFVQGAPKPERREDDHDGF